MLSAPQKFPLPTLPFNREISHPGVGTEVCLKGHPLEDRVKAFTLSIHAPQDTAILLSCLVGGMGEISATATISGSMTSDVTKRCALPARKNLKILVSAKEHVFEVFLNDTFILDFVHRINPLDFKTVRIEGPIIVEEVVITPGSVPAAMNDPLPPPPSYSNLNGETAVLGPTPQMNSVTGAMGNMNVSGPKGSTSTPYGYGPTPDGKYPSQPSGTTGTTGMPPSPYPTQGSATTPYYNNSSSGNPRGPVPPGGILPMAPLTPTQGLFPAGTVPGNGIPKKDSRYGSQGAQDSAGTSPPYPAPPANAGQSSAYPGQAPYPDAGREYMQQNPLYPAQPQPFSAGATNATSNAQPSTTVLPPTSSMQDRRNFLEKALNSDQMKRQLQQSSVVAPVRTGSPLVASALPNSSTISSTPQGYGSQPPPAGYQGGYQPTGPPVAPYSSSQPYSTVPNPPYSSTLPSSGSSYPQPQYPSGPNELQYTQTSGGQYPAQPPQYPHPSGVQYAGQQPQYPTTGVQYTGGQQYVQPTNYYPGPSAPPMAYPGGNTSYPMMLTNPVHQTYAGGYDNPSMVQYSPYGNTVMPMAGYNSCSGGTMRYRSGSCCSDEC